MVISDWWLVIDGWWLVKVVSLTFPGYRSPITFLPITFIL
jgi:hypothetical protein